MALRSLEFSYMAISPFAQSKLEETFCLAAGGVGSCEAGHSIHITLMK